MKRRFEVLRHADLQTKEEIARLCPPGDSRRLDRIFETCMRKLNAETDEAEEIPERRRPQWMYAVIAASCLLICGGTAAAIGTLNSRRASDRGGHTGHLLRNDCIGSGSCSRDGTDCVRGSGRSGTHSDRGHSY